MTQLASSFLCFAKPIFTCIFCLPSVQFEPNISILIFWYPQEALQDEIKALEGRVSSIQEVLGDLKVQLYAKFGNNINLEAEES